MKSYQSIWIKLQLILQAFKNLGNIYFTKIIPSIMSMTPDEVSYVKTMNEQFMKQSDKIPTTPAQISEPELVTPSMISVAEFTEEVPEEIIEAAADQYGPNNKFQKMLLAAEFYRRNGMTPMYLTDKDHTVVKIICKETHGKLLH